MSLTKNKLTIIFTCLIIISLLLFGIDLFIGSVRIPFYEVLNILFKNTNIKPSWQIIVLDSRLPQAICAVLAGAALSVSGLKMQTLFKNPLAGPYILGISSGAGLGVAIYIMGLGFLGLNFTLIKNNPSIGTAVAAIIGAMAVLLILVAVIRKLKDIMTVLILGVMLGSIITAIIGIIQYFSYEAELKSFILWTMGDLSSVTNEQLIILFPIVGVGIILSFLLSKSLNGYLMGENYAKSIGININTSRIAIIFVTALLSGSITAFCGPIGFIGIVVPHFARMMSNTYNHKILIPLTILLGINVLLFADIVSKLPSDSYHLPINSITALIGIPFIIWMIFKNKKITNLN